MKNALIIGGVVLGGYLLYKKMAPAPLAPAAPAQPGGGGGFIASLVSKGSDFAAGLMASAKGTGKSSSNPMGYKATKEDIAQLEGDNGSLSGYSIVGGKYGSLG